MNLMDTMEHTLQRNEQDCREKSTLRAQRKLHWPTEFKRPIDAAVHIGTPKPPKTRHWRVALQSIEFFLD